MFVNIYLLACLVTGLYFGYKTIGLIAKEFIYDRGDINFGTICMVAFVALCGFGMAFMIGPISFVLYFGVQHALNKQFAE